jgi:hypothetical protein
MSEKSGGAAMAVLDSGLKSKERNKVENLLDRIGLEIR